MSTGIDKSKILSDLDKTEDDITDILRIAEETVTELKKLPHCSEDSLHELSLDFLDRVRTVQEDLKGSADIILNKMKKEGTK